ncbi:hypothetical protein H4696_008024 [Amycolatopsis lexingtonensis]|uniref:Uncharacterized protein n=1 Tax=Amycolatopsis lexingtonensis TaxID=218822 RepID=A0ABR9ICN4_9PSEU|nr:hypothetical protein [Amycolatopsis lexingtonensis]MBE1500924.1 hypothetical protein [Amycolatopsis lexingtonensis]
MTKIAYREYRARNLAVLREEVSLIGTRLLQVYGESAREHVTELDRAWADVFKLYDHGTFDLDWELDDWPAAADWLAGGMTVPRDRTTWSLWVLKVVEQPVRAIARQIALAAEFHPDVMDQLAAIEESYQSLITNRPY